MEALPILRAYMLDLLQIILTPEYGAEALKVVGAYMLFRTDIKKLGKDVKDLASAFWAHVEQNDAELKSIKNHIGLKQQPKGEGET